MPSKTETYIPDQNNVTVTWLTNLSKLSQNDSSLGECLCHLKKHVTTCFFQKKKNVFFLQVPSEPKPILHLVCAVRPQPAAQLGARPKVFFPAIYFRL